MFERGLLRREVLASALGLVAAPAIARLSAKLPAPLEGSEAIAFLDGPGVLALRGAERMRSRA